MPPDRIEKKLGMGSAAIVSILLGKSADNKSRPPRPPFASPMNSGPSTVTAIHDVVNRVFAVAAGTERNTAFMAWSLT